MTRRLTLSVLTLLLAVQLNADAPLRTQAKGQYVEARTCDVWTGPCFANADFNLAGKNAVLAWRIDEGSVGPVSLNGLTVVAIVASHNTLGLEQAGPAKAVLILDKSATPEQQKALQQFALQQGGDLLANVVKVHVAPIQMTVCNCKGNACTELDAGVAYINTRCIEAAHDKACGNEIAYYPPLVGNVKAIPAAADHHFRGAGLGHTWSDGDRRGAYVGTFSVR